MTLIFFFNYTATTEIYTLSLHDALPICCVRGVCKGLKQPLRGVARLRCRRRRGRSEEHTSELQSLTNLVCRLLLEKKKTKKARGNRPQPSLTTYPETQFDVSTESSCREC